MQWDGSLPVPYPQCYIQNRNVRISVLILHISVLNGALWDMRQVHAGICEIGLVRVTKCVYVVLQRSICMTLTTPLFARIKSTMHGRSIIPIPVCST